MSKYKHKHVIWINLKIIMLTVLGFYKEIYKIRIEKKQKNVKILFSNIHFALQGKFVEVLS